jgi:acyl carrier protein
MNSITEIHEFVQGLLTGNGDEKPLTDSDSLFDSGRLQSIEAIEIVLYLEQNFGIDFAKIGFDREQLDSIEAIHALTQSACKIA